LGDEATEEDKQRFAASMARDVATCRQYTDDADRALGRALDLAGSGGRDARGQAVPPLTETALSLKKLGAAVTIQNQGTPQMLVGAQG
jgi:hypothetical protein